MNRIYKIKKTISITCEIKRHLLFKDLTNNSYLMDEILLNQDIQTYIITDTENSQNFKS